jgi:phenylalanyl-tRNA synthetase beta chain
MRVPLSWLRDYVDIELEPERLAERLTLLGMEVQSIERRGQDWRSIVIGELVEVTPHPNSPKLLLTRARVGDGQGDLSIVTGATNVAAGQRVPVAVPGAVLPGGRTIEVATLAGTRSEGMLCSGDELGLSEDADGILILPAEVPVGRPLSELYGDVILDVDVKPDRGDALSLVGLAREIAAATGANLRWPPSDPPESGDSSADHLAVEVAERDLCPRFVGRYLDGVRVAPSPFEIQVRLTAAGQRPLSNVVDATNYVMVELGKPTHVYDADRIAEGRILVRRAKAGERLETLDHVSRELGEETLVIADPQGPLGIAGVMGGASSEVGEGTTRVVIESAIFDPVSIRRTAQRFGLRSEASIRFEKGQEWGLAAIGADRVARLIAEWSDARVAGGRVDTDPSEPPRTSFAFRPARVARLLGVDVPAAEMSELLAGVGIEVTPARAGVAVPVVPDGPAPQLDEQAAAEALLVTIPPHRRDLRIEADIAEEVARLRGYETVPARLPETPMPPYRPDPRRLVDEVRELLSGRGLSEAIPHALIGPVDHARLGIPDDDPGIIRVANPVAPDHSELRRELLPGLIRTLAVNERQRRSGVALFEIGAVHRLHGGEPVEARRLGILLAGDWTAGAWDRQAEPADVGDLKGIISWLVERLGLGRVAFTEIAARDGVEHPGRLAAVTSSEAGPGTQLGRVSELHPSYLEAYEIRTPRVAYAEIDLEELERRVPERRTVQTPPRVPAVERDLAVIVRERQPAAEVEAVIREAAGELLRELELLSRYEGPQLGPDEVSLAYRLRLQAADRTLTEDEVKALLDAVTAALGEQLGARLRA